MMLAVARRFAVAYMPYQVGRLPRVGAHRDQGDTHARVRALSARSAAAADPATDGAPEHDQALQVASVEPTGTRDTVAVKDVPTLVVA
jgi:hypothetical protein